MPEFEREIKNNINPSRSKVTFVSDQERARRGYFQFNLPDEIVDHGGNFNALDGTHPHTREDAAAINRALLAQQYRQNKPETLVPRALRAAARVVHFRKP